MVIPANWVVLGGWLQTWVQWSRQQQSSRPSQLYTWPCPDNSGLQSSNRGLGRRCREPGWQASKSRNQCMGRECSWPLRSLHSPVLQVPGVGPHGQGVPYTSIHFKPAQGELSKYASLPHQWQPHIPTPTPDQEYSIWRWPDREAFMIWSQLSPFLNLDPITHLVGWSSEAPIIVDGKKVIVLIDLGEQVSSVSSRFCKQMALKVHPLEWLLELEGTGGSAIPYMGYVEVNLQIPVIRGYNKDVLLLVVPTMTYAKKVLVVMVSKIIDMVMGMIRKGELANTTTTWRQAHFCVVISGLLQLPYECTRRVGSYKGNNPLCSPRPHCI